MTKLAHRSTDQYDVGRYRQHGRADLSFDGVIMRFESEGPFNRELIRAAGAAMRDLLSELPPNGAWGEIVWLRNSALIAPEVLPALQELIEDLTHEGLVSVATAIVAADDVEGFSLMIPPYAAIYAANHRQFEVFERLEDAEAWMHDRLAATKS
jgi:hypothetical protein